MFNTLLKKLYPHLLVILIFIVVISYFFYPHWQGKVIQQGDVSSWQGSAREIIDYNKTHPDDPALWTGTMFSGMPSYQISTPMDYNFFNYIQKLLALGFLTGPIAIFFYCSVSFYILYLVLGLNIGFACVGALATSLVTGNFIVYEAGHIPKLVVLSMIGFILAGMILSYRGKWLQGAALFGLGMGINILNNHVQMSYYTFLLMLPLIFSFAYFHFKDKDIKGFLIPSGILTGITVLALLASSSTIFPTYEYAKETMRGGHILSTKSGTTDTDINAAGLQWDYAMNWSNGLEDLFSCIIPGAAGGGTSEPIETTSATVKNLRKQGYNPPKRMQAPLYWGSLPFTSGPFYFGAVMCLLFVLGLFTVKGPIKWWIAISVTLGLLLSMGKHFEMLNHFLFNYLPLYSKFRAPSSILSVVSYFFPILGMMAIYQLTQKEQKDETLIKKLYYSVGITGGICLFFAALGPSFFGFSHPSDPNYLKQGFDTEALIADRKSLMQSDSFRSLLLILASAGILWLYIKNKTSTLVVACVLGALILFDFGGVATRYVHKEDFISKSKKEQSQKPRPVDNQILSDKSTYRVLDLTVNTFNSAMPSFFHNHVGGYHPAKLQRYQDIIDRHIDPEINQLFAFSQNAGSDSSLTASLSTLSVLNMLNTKYYILGQPGKEVALPNSSAMGNAWLIQNIKFVNSPDEEIADLEKNNLKQFVIIHKEFESKISKTQFDGNGSIKLSSYSPNKLTYEFDSQTDQFVVFSEVWYGPDLGWHITIDGKETELVRANYVLRAAQIPAGKHQIVMEFKPRSFALGKTLSMLCSLLLIGLIGFVGYREFKNLKSSTINKQ
ncbi:MAG: YfhO family protein [Saprospiraceae bacterium]|nr:YfhO family protein [Saprospiraceae bacterium]MBK9221169.1 YfhO family protein [Saprospiraceae bacterium]